MFDEPLTLLLHELHTEKTQEITINCDNHESGAKLNGSLQKLAIEN